MRVMGLVLAVALAGGCASGGNSNRSMVRNILIAAVVGSAGLAVGAAVAGRSVENDLRDDLASGTLTGREFADRDAEGRRWNRVARASTFVGGLSVIGLGIVWEMGVGDSVLPGPTEPAPAADQRPPAASSAQAPGLQFGNR